MPASSPFVPPPIPAPAAPSLRATLDVIDMHTAGEPVRIVTGGYPELAGASILDKRREAAAKHDHLRTILMHEPRGHAGMYGVIPVAPSLPGAGVACLFTHASGYSTMCGHATIAIGRWAVESGLVAHDGKCARFGLEVPCGLVEVEARLDDGGVASVAFVSVPAFVEGYDVAVEVDGRPVLCDLVFGGAYYAVLPASRLGAPFDCGLAPIVRQAKRFFEAARATMRPRHPIDPDLSFLYGVILTDDVAPASSEPSRNLCLFGSGQIDRSPTGSGVTGRMALDVLAGRIPLGYRRQCVGPTGEGFVGAAIERLDFHGRPAVRVRVEGRAFYTGSARFIVERDDRLANGFLLFPSESEA